MAISTSPPQTKKSHCKLSFTVFPLLRNYLKLIASSNVHFFVFFCIAVP